MRPAGDDEVDDQQEEDAGEVTAHSLGVPMESSMVSSSTDA